MDAKVLEAQKWVNATYGGVAGYVRAPEDGKTGWPTMYSLTRALQHELGITELSDAFGPATLAALAPHGDIGSGETNTNIIRIIQCGCYCKGYDPGGITGDWAGFTGAAIEELRGDSGLGGPGTVPPKVFKALLTMDAYVLLAGGSNAVRSVQRWLNGRYLNRSQFFVIPCDGHFSRDVQTALLFAIQYELGMSDSQATGAFGPGTQAGLKSQGIVDLGSSDGRQQFVHLFRAAMVFNGASNDFSGNFDDNLAQEVTAFQKFSELPVTGRGDFQTWASLLVSTGDPTRPGTACDCSSTVTAARAQSLVSAGYEVVGRYLINVEGSGFNKKLQPGELDTIFSHNLKVFPIYQSYGGEASYFTSQQGQSDALAAQAAAESYGFAAGTVIYFAVDYDATGEEIDTMIVPYFKGVSYALGDGGKYFHGVYGTRNVCARVTKETGARWSFVSGMSTGFSGNMGFPLPENWAFNQIATTTVGSGDGYIEIDKDIHKAGTDSAESANPKCADIGNGTLCIDATFGASGTSSDEVTVTYYKTGGSPRHVYLAYLSGGEPVSSGGEGFDVSAGQTISHTWNNAQRHGSQCYTGVLIDRTGLPPTGGGIGDVYKGGLVCADGS